MTDFNQALRAPLQKGALDSPTAGSCVMERVAILWALNTGHDVNAVFSDLPLCTNEVVARNAQRVNDLLDDENRQRLNHLIPRLLRARRTDSDHRINTRLAIWAARKVLHLVREEDLAAALEAIEAAEAWLENPCAETVNRCAAYASTAYASTAYASADAAACAAADATAAAYTAAAYAAAAYAAAADAAAADATAAAYTASTASTAKFDLVLYLDELLDQWEEAASKEGEDLFIAQPWDDDLLAFVSEYMADEPKTPPRETIHYD